MLWTLRNHQCILPSPCQGLQAETHHSTHDHLSALQNRILRPNISSCQHCLINEFLNVLDVKRIYSQLYDGNTGILPRPQSHSTTFQSTTSSHDRANKRIPLNSKGPYKSQSTHFDRSLPPTDSVCASKGNKHLRGE